MATILISSLTPIGTWTLMPLSISIAFKHNRKDLQYRRGRIPITTLKPPGLKSAKRKMENQN